MQAFMGAESHPGSDQSYNTARKSSLAQDDEDSYQPRKTSTRVDWDEDHPLISIKLPKATGASSTDADTENTEMHFISKA